MMTTADAAADDDAGVVDGDHSDLIQSKQFYMVTLIMTKASSDVCY